MATKNTLFKGKNRDSSGSGHERVSSIPAFSTYQGAQKAPFLLPTDKPLTTMALPKVRIYTAKDDLSKQWFIEFYCLDLTGTKKRVRVMHDINDAITLTDRRERAEGYRKVYQDKLSNGWNFFHKPDKGTPAIDDNILACIQTYLYEKRGQLALKTYKKYLSILNNTFAPYLKEKHLDKLTISQIDKRILLDFLAHQAKVKKWQGNKTYNNYLLDLNTFFNYFIDHYDNIIVKNPLKGVRKLKTEAKGNAAYSDQQINDLKDYLQKENAFLLFFCQTVYETCTRPQSETRHLKCGMFDFQRGVLRITSDIAKNGTTDYVPLRKEFLDRLREYGVDKAFPDDYLFTRYRKPGKLPIREMTLQLWYSNAKKALNLGQQFSIYSWKHTRNIHVWLDTKDVMFIKTLNRHKTLEMTMKYLRDLGCFVDNQELLEKTRTF